MDKDCFNGAGIPLHQPMEFQAAAAAAMAVQWNGQNCPSEMGFLNPNLDHFSHMESSLSSFVSSSSSPGAAANEAFLLRELIGKFGGSGTPAGHCVDEVNLRSGLNSAKVHFPIVDQINPNLGNSVTLPPPPPPLQSIAADPGFIERAAKFSCFGSRSFNGRSSPIGNGSTTPPLTVESKLHRVASSPALKPNGSPLQNRNISPNSTQILTEIKPAIIPIAPPSDKKMGKTAGSGSGANSNEESSVSNGETLSKNETSSSRKRKGASRVKSNEEGSSLPVNKGDDDGNAKRPKATTPESSKNETLGKTCSNNDEKAADKKPPEPPKDYIHVRARRGQATDSHSLAERVRREKISERMKLLQDLVPGCNKVTGKALMLDEIINYVQSLQRQVEFLSMKLASVNPGLDFNTENLLSKDTVYHHNTSLPPPQQMYPTPEVPLYQHNVQQQLHQETSSISRGPLSHSPVDHPLHFSPVVDGFTETFPQFPGFSEDDLHSIVQMGFLQNPTNFPAVPNMKIER